MWRRVYLLLLLVRLWFALSPSYLHPDENFQGPEVIAGRIFGYPVHLTWEFTSKHPIRSSFPLWICYGIPMAVLRGIGEGIAEEVPPYVVYWTLRVMMFVMSFVLEDWAILELVAPHQRSSASMLVASSYVTWTLQTHTFSNSLETLVLIWSLVLIGRILEDKKRSSLNATALLGFFAVGGFFNRITFPAYLIIPLLQLIPHFHRKPLSLIALLLSATVTTIVAIMFDTAFYHPEGLTLTNLIHHPVITPLNNLLYNSSAHNLAQHGLHPYYQHIVANLPQLIGPAFPLLLFSYRKNLRLAAALSGVGLLSIFPHQEARFLLPAVPLILSSIRVPTNKRVRRAWMATWVAFNAAMGLLMGVYHQGGVVPAQIWIARSGEPAVTSVYWWKTYSPPVWLLNGKNELIDTVDLMGMKPASMVERVANGTACSNVELERGGREGERAITYLVAPRSATFLDAFSSPLQETGGEKRAFELEEVWSYKLHLNLDDMDFGDDGVVPTLQRIVGRRGIVVWKVKKQCGSESMLEQ
ncbi:gpi mannosyltransferase 4 [Diplodia corticola]|uniref:Mannosyltransferase n=1 Tax=Diplodia corticola TaxID=236234 RepID=A0A1J9REH7_9PEZI|nr:gpi mannosyltransferase 4 [Diplodia corticola]OJD38944.1 gpi mannosyltransferase 4 [Diplodia corticola]